LKDGTYGCELAFSRCEAFFTRWTGRRRLDGRKSAQLRAKALHLLEEVLLGFWPAYTAFDTQHSVEMDCFEVGTTIQIPRKL